MQKTAIGKFAFLTLFVALNAANSFGALLTSAYVSYSGMTCEDYFTPCTRPARDSAETLGTANATATLAIQAPGSGVLTGLANASYGSIEARALANTGGWKAAGGAGPFLTFHTNWSGAGAGFSDTLTILGGSGTGWVEATLWTSCCELYAGAAGGWFELGASSRVLTQGGIHTLSAPFSFGVPFDIQAFGGALASDLWPNDPWYGAGEGYFRLHVAGLRVLNSGQPPASGFSYRSGSGSAYAFENAGWSSGFGGLLDTPEPAARVLWLAGAILLGVSRLAARLRAASA